jgi:DNA-binding NarL/FixJ family response regulator
VDDLSAVRVLVVDDCEQWRDYITAYLWEQSVRIVGTAADGLQAVYKAGELQPDLIIMDIWMPGLNGLAATREIHTFMPGTRVLIVTNDRDPSVVQAAFAAGARGYVLKPHTATDLLKAIDAIGRDEVFIGTGVRTR